MNNFHAGSRAPASGTCSGRHAAGMPHGSVAMKKGAAMRTFDA